MNKIKKLTSIFRKLFSKTVKITLLCTFGIFTIYPLGIDQNRSAFIRNSAIPNSNTYFPFNDFVFISVNAEISVNSTPMGVVKSSASGVVVSTVDKSKTYILTAGHVCDPSFEEEMGSTPYSQEISIRIFDYYGFQHDASVIGVDNKHDLCLLSSEDIWTDGSPIAHGIPSTGEKVYAISAPHSIFSPGNALLFDGYFTGFDDEMSAFYTIPTKPGSSGGGIFNDNGNIVGIIHSAPSDFENLAIASSLENVKQFMSNYVIFVTSY